MDNIRRKIGHPNQLIMARRIAFRDGVSDGIRAIELKNTAGLYMTCIEDLCMNLYDFSYKGVNFAFQSKNGLVSNRFFSGGCEDFGHYWPAGMLYTCGLTSTGSHALEDGVFFPVHGRIGMMPAENVSIEELDDAIVLRGSVRESLLCGENLCLHRSIRFPTTGKEVEILDEVENGEDRPAEFMLLYHCNIGYPLLDEGSRVLLPKGETNNRTPGDAPLQRSYAVTTPRSDKEELVWVCRTVSDANGYGCSAVINETLQLGVYLRYKTDTLPYFIHWNNLCSQDYCVGLEPSNCLSMGRTAERKNGTLPVLPPYGKQQFHLYLGVLDGANEINAFRNTAGGIAT